jgi:DnaJ like chaperone protein
VVCGYNALLLTIYATAFCNESDSERSLKIVSLLVDHGAEVNFRSLENGTTALLAACSKGSPAIVDFLLKQGADPNARSATGETALSISVHFLRIINRPTDSSDLERNSRQKRLFLNILDLLLRGGANANDLMIVPNYGEAGKDLNIFRTPLDFAISHQLGEAEAFLNAFTDNALRTAAGFLLSRFQNSLKELGNAQQLVLPIRNNQDTVFLLALSFLLGSLACVDGFPTREELSCFSRFLSMLQLDGRTTAALTALFAAPAYLRQEPDKLMDQFTSDLDLFRKVLSQNPFILMTVADLLYEMGVADGTPQLHEKLFLETVAKSFGLNQSEYASYANHCDTNDNGNSSLESCYRILNCSMSQSDDEIKSRYRQLAKNYHPDMIHGKGLPKDFVTFASERFREIQEAYDTIMKHRRKPL